MNLDYVPLVPVMRELHRVPRGRERFRKYLWTINPGGGPGDQLLPLVAMNPMGKDHVAALLDALLVLDADAIAAQATAEAAAVLANVPGDCKVGLVVADDLMGGWTNRYADEYTHRFGPDSFRSGSTRPRWLKADWLTCVLWSSEPASARAVREAVLTVAHRRAYVHRHGPARTLRDMMAQEGHVMAAAGCETPTLDAEDIEYSREVLSAYVDAEDRRTCMECLFGDEPGRTLGLTPRGLSPWAGLAVALHDA